MNSLSESDFIPVNVVLGNVGTIMYTMQQAAGMTGHQMNPIFVTQEMVGTTVLFNPNLEKFGPVDPSKLFSNSEGFFQQEFTKLLYHLQQMDLTIAILSMNELFRFSPHYLTVNHQHMALIVQCWRTYYPFSWEKDFDIWNKMRSSLNIFKNIGICEEKKITGGNYINLSCFFHSPCSFRNELNQLLHILERIDPVIAFLTINSLYHIEDDVKRKQFEPEEFEVERMKDLFINCSMKIMKILLYCQDFERILRCREVFRKLDLYKRLINIPLELSKIYHNERRHTLGQNLLPILFYEDPVILLFTLHELYIIEEKISPVFFLESADKSIIEEIFQFWKGINVHSEDVIGMVFSCIFNLRNMQVRRLRETLNIKMRRHLSPHIDLTLFFFVQQNEDKNDYNDFQNFNAELKKLLDALQNVDPFIAVLTLNGIYRIEQKFKSIDTLIVRFEPLCKHVLRMKEILTQWYSTDWDLTSKSDERFPIVMLRTLNIFKRFQLPLFIDNYGKRTSFEKFNLSCVTDPFKPLIIQRGSEMYHVTHKKEAGYIQHQRKFNASDNKNAVKGVWFRIKNPKEGGSHYGSVCFETTFKKLGITRLNQGEIIVYKEEVNVILIADDYDHYENGENEMGGDCKDNDEGKIYPGLIRPTDQAAIDFLKKPNAHVEVSIFVPERFLPRKYFFWDTISGPEKVKHGNFCIKAARLTGNRQDCQELSE